MKHDVKVVFRPFQSFDKEYKCDNKCRYILKKNPFDGDRLGGGAIEGYVDNSLGGSVYVFPIRFYADGNLYNIMSGSTFWVNKKFRKYELGLMIPEKMLEMSCNYILGGVSSEAQPVYQYYGFQSFKLKRYVYIVNSHFLINLIIKGLLAKSITMVADLGLHMVYCALKAKFWMKYRKYSIVERNVSEIDYTSVDHILKAGGQRFMEMHNRPWIEWVMNYDGADHHFYEVYLHNKMVGFFINKIVFREKLNGRYNNVNYGSIIEWGSVDQNLLKDSDLCALAVSQFGTKVDAIDMSSIEDMFSSEIPSVFKRKMGDLNIEIILDDKQFVGYKNSRNWRIRPAYGDNSF